MRNIFRKGRPTNFKLGMQMDHEDPYQYHQQAPWFPRSKVKIARLRALSDSCWPISRERKVQETPKLVGWLPTARAIMGTSFKVRSHRSRSTGRLMLRSKVSHIFRKGRPTNFKLGTQMDHDDLYHSQAPWPLRLKVKVASPSDRCSPISLERKVPETPNSVERLTTPRAITRSRFEVKRSMGKVTRLTLKPKVCRN